MAQADSVMDHHHSLNRTAFQATAHCLTGCAIGEVLGLVIGTALGWDDIPTIALAVVLAFFFGYALTVGPLLRGGLALRSALRLALIGDTISIIVMEVTDNAVILAIPGAMDAWLASATGTWCAAARPKRTMSARSW